MVTDPTVLIVDDNRDIRAAHAEFLRCCGFQVLVTADGLEGVAAAYESSPDVIVMDLAMPRMDGWEAIRHLKENPQTAGIPIIAVSAYAFDDEALNTRELGADACLSKPCLPSQVALAVKTLLAKGELEAISWE
jgi:two-component system, cell cycle response regulator DivK